MNRESDERRIDELLRAHDRAPARALASRVMARLDEPRRRPFAWRPLVLAGFAAALLLGVGAGSGYLAGRRASGPALAASGAPLRTVRFALEAPGARTVVLVGDFNGWSPEKGTVLTRAGDRFVATVELPPGRYAYGFMVDGHKVEPDPLATETQPDGFGGRDSVLEL